MRAGFFLLFAGLAASVGCDDEGSTAGGVPAVTTEVVAHYGALVEATYADSRAAAEALKVAVDGFLAAPDSAKLEAARRAWLAAREPYLQSEVFRFYDGPIDHPETGPEGQINAWPLDEAYIDGGEGAPEGGIIQDTSVALTTEALLALNEQGGEKNIATGFHAIEFLLWGQDRSADGPGDRLYTDFLPQDQGGTAPFPERRTRYLEVVTTLLVSQLTDLTEAWGSDPGTYRAALVAEPPTEGLRRILTGMIVLAGFETGGERLQTALDSGDQEDEHSCFSDNTHRDMVQDVRGLQNVWLGRYERLGGGRVEGPGVQALVADQEADLARRIDGQLAKCLTLAEALVPPFDQEILPGNPAGRARVEALITALRDLEGLLQDAFRLFGLTIPVAE